MKQKVLMILWQGSAYDSLRALLLLAGAELSKDGYEIEEVLLHSQGWESRLYDLVKSGDIACGIGMSGLGADLSIDAGKTIWETLRIPFFNWNCDHPCYYPQRATIRSQYVLHGYVFPDHAQYATQHFSPNGIAYSAHLAMPTRELFIRQPLKAKARNGRVMFTKSGADTNKIMEQWRVLPSALQQLLRDCTEELYHSSTQDFLPVIQKLAEPLGLHIMGNSNAAMVLIRELDQFIRFDRSNRIAKAACRFPVDIFGTGWDHFDWPQNGNVRFHGSLTWLDIMKQLPQYLGCLSTNPLVEQSVHDRVFFALSAGVVPVSNANNFSRKNMPLLSPYSFDQSEESVASALDAMLTNPDDALEHTESTWAALTPRYTLHHSVRQIVDFCKMASFNTVVTPEMK